MMHHQYDMHAKQVELWEKKYLANSSVHEQLELFEKALYAIVTRANATLSKITIEVVLDRVLYQSTEKYSQLSLVEIQNGQFIVKSMKLADEGWLPAVRYLLIELLGVFGRLTAEILTIPLHKELMQVSSEKL